MSSGHSEGPSTDPDDWKSPYGTGADHTSGGERLPYDRERSAQGRPSWHARSEHAGAFGHQVSPYDDRPPDVPVHTDPAYTDPAHTAPAYPDRGHGAPTSIGPDHYDPDHTGRGHDRERADRTYADHDHTGGHHDTGWYGDGGHTAGGYGDGGHTTPGYGKGHSDTGHATGEYAGRTRPDHADPYPPGYGQGYAEQPHAPGHAPGTSRATESVRTHAIIVMVVGIVLSLSCFLSIGGLVGAVLSGVALGRVDADTRGARNLLRWAWIGIGANVGLIVLGAAAFIVAGLNHAFGP